jgi:hypothetical protein
MTKTHNFRKENNDTVTHIPVARERLGKHARNKYAPNNTGRPVLGTGRVFYGSASRLYK